MSRQSLPIGLMTKTMADLSILEVMLYGEEIGTLTLLPGDRTLFAFNQSYIDNPNRDTLSLSFKDSLGELITDTRPTQTKVPPFFSNLLPEGQLREYLAQRAGVKEQREFHLLWVLGQDLPGGISIKPVDGEAWPPDNSQFSSAIDNHEHDGVLRFSLAGVQLKFSAVVAVTGGLTIPAQGIGGSWIVKLPSSRFEGVPDNEYSMMTLARSVGIDVPEFKLYPLNEIEGLPEEINTLKGSAFVIKRFDRTGDGGVVHMEDFAQVFNVYPGDKYDRASYRNIAEVIWVEMGEEGVTEFIRRLVFSTLIGNADMHLKNWSLIYPDRRNAALSPAYDFVSTIPYLSSNRMALTFMKTKMMTDLTFDVLSKFAAKAKLPEKLVIDTAKETVVKFHEAWVQQKSHLPLNSTVIEVINTHIKSIPIAS